mgnify:CR=1 FL=1
MDGTNTRERVCVTWHDTTRYKPHEPRAPVRVSMHRTGTYALLNRCVHVCYVCIAEALLTHNAHLLTRCVCTRAH